MQHHLILGTAGHIDHGKTSLIRALTGTETDRLPEEKKRGITIELGYAQLELDEFQMGIVDVPGHEKFVRQMLAGATGMDLALLVVAADDSIKPQTREHLDILRLLNLSAGVIALTKIDMVDREWGELVEQEIRELVAGSFLEDAPIVPVSSKTGEGIDALKQALVNAARKVHHGHTVDPAAPFRMAIDRVFAVEGFGTVVTGSVSSGHIGIGDQIEIQPQGRVAKIRSLQNHDRQCEQVQRGQRAAINLTGIHHDEIHRGDELASPGHLIPTRQLGIEMRVLPDLERKLRDRARVRLHVGTAEVAANLRLPGHRKELLPGDESVALLYLQEPVVAVWGQPFVLRLESPVVTLGGGRVLFANRLQRARPTEREWSQLQLLQSPDPQIRSAAAVFLLGFSEWTAADLARLAGVADAAGLLKDLQDAQLLNRIEISRDRRLNVHRERVAELGELIEAALERAHRLHPLRLGHPLLELQSRFDYLPSPDLFRNAIKTLQNEKKITIAGPNVALVGHGPQLSKGERLLMDDLLNRLKEGGVTPDTPVQLKAAATKNRDSVPQLIQLGIEGGQLIRLTDDWVIHNETWEAMRQQLQQAFREKPSMTVSDIKEVFGLSRKFAVPLCEFLDRQGLTTRQGDERNWCDTGLETHPPTPTQDV